MKNTVKNKTQNIYQRFIKYFDSQKSWIRILATVLFIIILTVISAGITYAANKNFRDYTDRLINGNQTPISDEEEARQNNNTESSFQMEKCPTGTYILRGGIKSTWRLSENEVCSISPSASTSNSTGNCSGDASSKLIKIYTDSEASFWNIWKNKINSSNSYDQEIGWTNYRKNEESSYNLTVDSLKKAGCATSFQRINRTIGSSGITAPTTPTTQTVSCPESQKNQIIAEYNSAVDAENSNYQQQKDATTADYIRRGLYRSGMYNNAIATLDSNHQSALYTLTDTYTKKLLAIGCQSLN